MTVRLAHRAARQGTLAFMFMKCDPGSICPPGSEAWQSGASSDDSLLCTCAKLKVDSGWCAPSTEQMARTNLSHYASLDHEVELIIILVRGRDRLHPGNTACFPASTKAMQQKEGGRVSNMQRRPNIRPPQGAPVPPALARGGHMSLAVGVISVILVCVRVPVLLRPTPTPLPQWPAAEEGDGQLLRQPRLRAPTTTAAASMWQRRNTLP
eukprot:scaffold117512_cov19-Tisochrysis_lutea.AAC.1